MSIWLVISLALAILWLANRYQLWRVPKPKSWPRLLMYHSISNDASNRNEYPACHI
jgi:hypothetical protein